MNANLVAAILHLKEASNLFQDIHPELSKTLLNIVNAFIKTNDDALNVSKMEEVSDRIINQTDNGIID